MKVTTEIWIATALLHRAHREQGDFSVGEIVDRALEENLHGGYRPGLQIHASTHSVANKPPNPGRYRMLFETSRGRRRLYKAGDEFHPYREGGKVRPEESELPPDYQFLIEWYDKIYTQKRGRKRRQKLSQRRKLR